MAVFSYKAAAADLSTTTGVIVADTPRQARDELRARGLIIQDIRERSSPSVVSGRRFGGGFARSGTPAMKPAQVSSFIRELSTLLAVGTPLAEALALLARQAKGPASSTCLHLGEQIASGSTLADAMRRQPRVFDAMACSITEVGETTGTLDVALSRLAEFRDKSQSLKNRVATALIYPAIVFTMSIVVSVLLMTVVVPNLLSALEGAGRTLPLPTRIVKFGSDQLLSHGFWLLIAAIGIGFLFRHLILRPRGRRLWHAFKLRAPLIGPLVQRQAILRLSVVLSTLLRAGLPFTRSLSIAAAAMDNVIIRAALQAAEHAITTGRPMGFALESTRVFPPVVIQVFTLGQQSGRLEDLLDRLATDYDSQLTQSANRLTAVLEPVLILFLVGIVGLIGFATVLPMLEAADAF